MTEWICRPQLGEDPSNIIVKAWEAAVHLGTIAIEAPDGSLINVKKTDTEGQLREKRDLLSEKLTAKPV